jgi:hypothetical protein
MLPLLCALLAASAPPGRISIEHQPQSRVTGRGWAVVRLLDEHNRPVPIDAARLSLRGVQGTRASALRLDEDARSARAWVEPARRGGTRVVCLEALWDGAIVGGLQLEEPLPGPLIDELPELAARPPPASEAAPGAAELPRVVVHELQREAPADDARPIEPPRPPDEPPWSDVLGPPTALVAAPPPASPWLPPRTAVRARTQLDLGGPGRSAALLAAVDAQSGNERAAFGLSASSGRLLSGSALSAQASLSGRARLYAGDALALAAGLDASLPGSGPESIAPSPLRTRASLAAGARFGDWSVTTSHALVAGTASSALRPHGWDGSLSVAVQLPPALQAAAQVDALASGASDAGYKRAAAVGAGLLYRLGPVSLGGSVRAGLGPDGAALFGRAGASALVLWEPR